ncbi:hypothetical protein [Paenibacillus macquariensis]|nr:hypothetical protein [Paenibacillus macquariensis]MEC0090574.1 hypothetical protein [Paenibacillus macquariensis]
MPTSRKEVLRNYGEPTYNGQSSLDYDFEAEIGRLADTLRVASGQAQNG